jgi:hypothetical protein
MDRIRSVEAARTAWRHHHLLGIGGARVILLGLSCAHDRSPCARRRAKIQRNSQLVGVFARRKFSLTAALKRARDCPQNRLRC